MKEKAEQALARMAAEEEARRLKAKDAQLEEEARLRFLENQQEIMKKSDEEIGCQCVGAVYAEDTLTCLKCGKHWYRGQWYNSAIRLKQLEQSVDEIYRDKLAETISSISSHEDFKQRSEAEQQEIITL